MRDDRAGFEDDWVSLRRHVSEQQSALVLLPELPFAPWFAFDKNFDAGAWADVMSAHRDWDARLGELAPAAVIATRPVERGAKRYNEAFAAFADGRRIALHDKRYLPDEPGFYEASWYERGDGAFDLADVAGAKVGMMICSELWVLDEARQYASRGADIILTPRATPASSLDKWFVAGRAAAMLAGAFSLSSNHAGQSRGGFRFGGGGWIVDPDGEVLARTSDEEPFATRDIDLGQARAAKSTYPRYLS
jgi:N-carbamoylputrescine amidase